MRTHAYTCTNSKTYAMEDENTVIAMNRPLVGKLVEMNVSSDSRTACVIGLLELRTKTGLVLIIFGAYRFFIKKYNSNSAASRKASNFGQQIIIDGIQRTYHEDKACIGIKHLELLVQSMGRSMIPKTKTMTRDRKNKVIFPSVITSNFPMEIMERVNWHQALSDWQKQEVTKSIVRYVPFLTEIGKSLTKRLGFLFGTSYLSTSWVLVRATRLRRRDCLIGKKGNVILGNCLQIGANARFSNTKITATSKNEPKYDFGKRNFSDKRNA